VATMDDLDKLPPDLVWQQDGHLADIVLSSIADGEVEIVPLEASSHLEHCEHCTTRFGAEALLSKHAGELLAELSRVTDRIATVATPRSVRAVAAVGFAKLPKHAFFGALFLAAMGAMPALLSPGHLRVAQITEILGRSIVMLARGVVLVAKSGSFTVLVWASAMILMVLGLVVSRFARPGLVNGLVKEGSV
jgi:hypothetical protein